MIKVICKIFVFNLSSIVPTQKTLLISKTERERHGKNYVSLQIYNLLYVYNGAARHLLLMPIIVHYPIKGRVFSMPTPSTIGCPVKYHFSTRVSCYKFGDSWKRKYVNVELLNQAKLGFVHLTTVVFNSN